MMRIIFSRKKLSQKTFMKGTSMKKLTIALVVFSLVLGGVSLAISGDLPQTSQDLSGFQKITDQEAQEIRGMGWGNSNMFQNAGANCPNPTCQLTQADTLTSVLQAQTRGALQIGDKLRTRDCTP
jgi:hypothetical protein